MLPKNLKIVFLDFDGVVVESANIKTLAFYDLYLPYGPNIAKEAMNYHIKHQGISRYKKFEEIHKLFLNQVCHEDEKNMLSQKFSEIVLKKILNCPFVEGALDFLTKMQHKNISVFLLSATPHEELLYICQERKIAHYFKAMFGAPYEKTTTGKDIIQKDNINKEEAIFIGDSLSDFNAATAINIPFLGRVPANSINPFNPTIPIIKNFKEIING